jgi:hypothetical protein
MISFSLHVIKFQKNKEANLIKKLNWICEHQNEKYIYICFIRKNKNLINKEMDIYVLFEGGKMAMVSHFKISRTKE